MEKVELRPRSTGTSTSPSTIPAVGVGPTTATRRPAGRWLLVVVVVVVVVVVTAGVVYPLARWFATRDAAHCDGDSAATLGALPQRSEPVGRFADDPSLIFVAALFRHGDRTPIFKCKTDPLINAFPEAKGELTKSGKQHMYKKGQIYRRLYNGFLSDLYLDSEIIIKTTNYQRTYMSAAMVLAGMYPPKGYQKWSILETVWHPIPIYHDSPDGALLFSHSEMCPAFKYTNDRIFSQMFDATDKNITVPLMSYLSEKCEQSITMKDLFFLYDLFKCQISANMQLPEWLKPNYWQTIQSIFQNEKISKIMNGNNRFQSFIVGRLLKEIATEMELRSNNSESRNTLRKMHLYSGHDISVGMVLGFMDAFVENVDFGASVHLHLHYDDKIGYTVKVFNFGRWDDEKGREVTMPNCSDHCKLRDFIKLVRDNFPRKLEEECQVIEK